ncbi:MAG TPA: hypothetical protein DEO88_16475, partial [Syntrophobacteraceae bacterium]|nr:hypothetical protein [Syntrophobacteraceae bacterium]
MSGLAVSGRPSKVDEWNVSIRNIKGGLVSFENHSVPQTSKYPSLILLFCSFLRMGITAFGGPAMIAYLRKMVVGQKQWIDGESFQDGVALCQTIPGATVMQMAAYI